MMRFYNPLYTRTWAKISVPVTTFFVQLGQQVGLNPLSGSENTDETITKNVSIGNGHILKDAYDDHPTLSEPSNSSSLSNFFSTITSPFRPRAPPSSSSSSFGNRPRRPHYKTAMNRQRFQNGGVEFSDTDSIYHQLHIHTVNDENNNAFISTTGTNKNQTTTSNGVIIHMPTSASSSSNTSSIGVDDDDDNGEKPLLPLTTPTTTTFAFGHYTREHLTWIATLSILYFVWFTLIAGIGPLHVLIYLAIMICYFASDRSRRLILALFIYLAYLFLYDSMRALPNHAVSNIHTKDVYTFEKRLFGIYSNGQLVTLNEYFQKHQIISKFLANIDHA